MKRQLILLFLSIFCLTNLLGQAYASLSVLVTEVDGKPIANALIRVEEAGWASKTTGDDGKAFYDNFIPIGKIHCTISKEGYQSEDAIFKITADDNSNTLHIKLSKRQDEKLLISGKVIDQNDIELSGAIVEVTIAGIGFTTTTGKSGNYTIELNLDRVKYDIVSIKIQAKCPNGNGRITEDINLPKKDNIQKDFKLDCNNVITKTTITNPPSINHWFGFGLLTKIGFGTIDNIEFLSLPYGAFLRAYMTKKLAFELQYHRSLLSIKHDLVSFSTGEKTGEISASFAYQDVTALLNFTSIRSKKNRFRSYGGAKISFRRGAEFEMNRTQSNFVFNGELPTLPQYTSVVFGLGYEFGGFGHKFPLIIADLRFDFGTNNIMREYTIIETNTKLEYGNVSSFGLQIGIGF